MQFLNAAGVTEISPMRSEPGERSVGNGRTEKYPVPEGNTYATCHFRHSFGVHKIKSRSPKAAAYRP